jgi:GNAT superfamily N-acetyltransferase
MSLVVRPALPADHAVLVEFNRAMAWETEEKSLDADILGRGVRGVFEDPRRGFYLVAARDGAVEGALLVTYEWSDWRCGDWWWLQSVYVRPPARGQGVFRALFDAVVARARDAGAVGLRLYVEQHNQAAQRTYERLGMRHDSYRMMDLQFAPAPRDA